jgi:glycine/D-amino acid oxidase-like deaminating enzyme
MEIAIVGGGWYGCHLALALKKAGHKVVLYEKNDSIFSQISGAFGIRLHAGPHYPRSAETRKNCLRNKAEFEQRYPDLIVPHEYSIYGLGTLDAEGKPPKVNQEEFEAVCNESESCKIIDPKAAGYNNLITAASIEEPSVVLGSRLRKAFTKYLADAGVEVRYHFDVQKITKTNNGVIVAGKNAQQHFDKVINTTSYQAFLPDQKDFPFEMETVYQPCLALKYEDQKPGNRPFSFIVMDGWFPCIMPVCDDKPGKEYILTHGKWTIMGSYDKPAKANDVLAKLNDEWIESNVKPSCEREINRFWPAFAERFRYTGWKGTVLAKLKTKREFRSAVTYEKDNVIQVVPGKISNVFDVEREVQALLTQQNILNRNGYFYVQGGVLQQGCTEIEEKPNLNESSTCTLQTFTELEKEKTLPVKIASAGQSMASSTPTTEETLISASFLLLSMIEIAASLALLALALLAFPHLIMPTALIAGVVISQTVNRGVDSLFSFFKNHKGTAESNPPLLLSY